MHGLSIFILCHNRPHDAQWAIASVLAQSDKNFILTVSDNSSTNDVQEMVEREFPHVHYVRRAPVLQALDHFNRCIEDVRTSHFCLFHDDDIMHPQFVLQVNKSIAAYPQAAALGCNARIQTLGVDESSLSFTTYRAVETLKGPRDLAARYFSRAQSGIAPFPGYVYNRTLVADLRFEPHGGKYSDVSWLLNLARKGNIIWINQYLMTYRIHSGNDGIIESRRDRLRFLGYLKQNLPVFGGGILQDYRCSFIYKKIRKNKDLLHPYRQHLATEFLRHCAWARYARWDTWKALAKRALVKWMGNA